MLLEEQEQQEKQVLQELEKQELLEKQVQQDPRGLQVLLASRH